jgi:PAS domain S-box-containing protein
MQGKRQLDFETLAETLAVAIIVVQGERIVYANAAAQELGGYTRDELLALPFWQLVHPDDRELVRKRATARQQGAAEPERYEVRLVTKGGEERWGEFSGTLIEYDGGVAVLGTAFDITERKRAVAALEESEDRYRTLFDENADGVAVVADGRIRTCNARMAEMMGRSVEELLGLSPVDLTAEEERAQVAARVQSVAEGGPEYPSVYHVPRPDGTLLPIEVISRLIQYEGRPAILSVVRDISERERAEQALVDARDELEGRVERQLLRRNPYGLSFRELTVLNLVAAGHSDKEIGAALGISPLTAQKHVSNILAKMGAPSRTQAGVRAVREGLLD